MNDLWLVSLGTGLRDGLNPCIFVTCAVFIVHRFWLGRNALKVGRTDVFFVLTYALGVLLFNFGPAQVLLFNKNFILAAKIIYFVLGLAAFVFGVLFIKDWIVLRRGLPLKNGLFVADGKEGKEAGWGVVLRVIVIALGLSALATLWPMNVYLMLLGNEALIKGQWQVIMPLISLYVAAGIWPLCFIWAFLSIKTLRPSLMKIVCAAIFFISSSIMILIFK